MYEKDLPEKDSTATFIPLPLRTSYPMSYKENNSNS